MSNGKTEFRLFLVPQWKQEEEYLSRQHKIGWKFVGVSGPGLYHFERCEPQAVTYRLDYNPDSVQNRAEYLQIFRDCGWEYLQNYMGYSYFRKPEEKETGGEEIFCDDDSRLDMLMRVFRGRMVPLLIIFFLVLLPQMCRPAEFPLAYVLKIACFVIFGVYLGIFLLFGLSWHGYYRSVHKK